MVVPLGSPQPVFTLPRLEDIPDDPIDQPVHVDGLPLKEIGPFNLPQIIFGAATFSGSYNSDNTIASDVPVRAVRLALRYGIRAFDTSAYYGPSEIVLGTALNTLEPLFPRSSYKLMTKCGRYGLTQSEFDYSPQTIRKSVERSLERLHTAYLDTVYLHDVEYVCTPVGSLDGGNPETALFEKSAEYGLAEGQEGKVWGEGDQKILDAYAELRRLQEEGKVKYIGITGYTLSTLLRLAILVLHTPPYKPLDILLSYCHLSLNNSTYATYAGPLRARAKVTQLVTASPLSMGLLTPSPPPWHPASAEIKAAAKEAQRLADEARWEGGLASLAVGYGHRKGQECGMPVVVGLSNTREVHESVLAWGKVQQGADREARVALEDRVVRAFGPSLDLSWASPPEELRK